MVFEERLAERTRVARDLHDTLLQRFQGVLLSFYGATPLGDFVHGLSGFRPL
jgi:signal transduction histidine kinase